MLRAPPSLRSGLRVLLVAVLLAAGSLPVARGALETTHDPDLDSRLARRLDEVGFSGRIEASLPARLGRSVDGRLADIGRLLWFDTVTGLNDDNTCGGCHSPTSGFADTQSIAIGIDNNGIVGPDRAGPHNMRRAPTVINSAFFPRLMWNSRFAAMSRDPFDNRGGFVFPPPESTSLSYLPHLLTAQAFIPPTERTEVAGFGFEGDNDAIRAEVVRRLSSIDGYRSLFGRVFPPVQAGGSVTFDMFAAAIAEFEFSLTFANAPLDRFARGEHGALSDQEERGALLFFGKAGCVACHSVAGESNEMFSDFSEHVLAVPQIVPGITNNDFDGPADNEDFGLEQVTGSPDDRYKFRTPPLRNLAVQPTFMHDGAFTSLEAAIRHHLHITASVRSYDPLAQNLNADLVRPIGPVDPLLARVDPLLSSPTRLAEDEFDAVVAFVRNGLLDPRAKPQNLRKLVPRRLPSGRAPLTFQFPVPPP